MLAKAGFQELSRAREELHELSEQLSETSEASLRDGLSLAADPDQALSLLLRLSATGEAALDDLDSFAWQRLCKLVGASPALGEFLTRHPDLIPKLTGRDGRLPSSDEARIEMLAAVTSGSETLAGEEGWNALRVKYRELLAGIALYDLTFDGTHPEIPDARSVLEAVAAALSSIADGALEAALAVARATLEVGGSTPPIDRERIDDVRFTIIAMGKCGAEELNVVSDVDVMFIAEGDERIATLLARETMRAIQDPAHELPLWQVDPNLRPEGRHGSLVRSLSSMLNYYERWAKTWEFQALIKARAAAGDLDLGNEFVDAVQPLVWASSNREDFVGSVQRMRERVTEHIDRVELDLQIKLGPGGLRDIEFSVQLLQLVHGQRDERLQLRGTLPALRALVEDGYVARADGERLSEHYQTLRVLEHRLQLKDLRRTALMPGDGDALRVLARASGLASTGGELQTLWDRTRREVRSLHLKIFYAPLLSAVAALPDEDFVLGSDEAKARLASIGFGDPNGAMRHLAALTGGSTRRARILRNLTPVLLQWLGEGTDPDYGLLSFRKVSEANQESSWYLKLLRDGAMAAERLTSILSNSRFAADLLESFPEGVAWLERDDQLVPPTADALLAEMRSLVSRRTTLKSAAERLRRVHRREILRLAMGRVVGVIDDEQVSSGLDSAHTALLDALLKSIRANSEAEIGEPAPAIALIGMGRFGGGELGFASDIDLVAVSREQLASGGSVSRAVKIITELRNLVEDPRFPVDLDFDLRPEGKSGPIVRSLESYRAYYERWSVTWEAQALLRARHVAGDIKLGSKFMSMADPIRYPETFTDEQLREVRRIKARVEAERLPHGADPKMHLKLGPGGISDVEWLVQLIQLKHGARHPELRTVSTLGALDAAVGLELLSSDDAACLRDAWEYASSVRSAMRLWSGRASDTLPRNWRDLLGIAGVLGTSRERTSEIVEQWFGLSRRARIVFEREFFGYTDEERFL
ncbi:bifunctional [glutamine synthetase] adenylyltransferase/[glutamine synthetase]-adenylyl-L-tyrosine phosphorylase [Leucobacter denitrificans]|uniref:bifunctional [glutamine synthetase] adenylyltransferase/[glutamine synthetase]-adenylyl-L-tyrosine phosphorylase n=1 Tax=Leucobacter denitrificans TaxID=683042 RepID=UPI001FE680E7|nr:bifunctional [glutamine synthetase] adenylyltransferase/[glutamine synthetase]-adenylyl-L-tyrosine phosphorylase [Leucobacter denitrificans]